MEIFDTLTEARAITNNWRYKYNRNGPQKLDHMLR